MTDPIIIIGAGQAGAALAAKLRELGYADPITLIGDEPALPYQRPPLSKKYLSGDLGLDRLLVRPASWYQDQRIDVQTGHAVAAIDPARKMIRLGDGRILPFGKLALTTGSRPRRLPAAIGGDFGGVFTMRDLKDADAIAPHLQPGKRLLIVGGGYIGLEAAAVAAAKGLSVNLIEMADRILQRVAAAETSDYFRELHRRHGVDLREAMGLRRLIGAAGQVTAAELADGARLDVDLVIVGIGISPNDDLARAAGLAVEDGIIVDEFCRTSAPDIFAAGDCARFTWHGLPTRLESVQNAIEQGERAAAAMLGAAAPYDPVPWFWSDQYDVKLQIAGLNRGYDSVVLRPGKRPGSQSIWYFQGERLLAVDAMNDALAYAFGKKILEAGRSLPKAAAADPATDLKSWAA
ncbi:MAG TPA: FAD-dependent oxidoreductase [Terriglobales bacterium]|nr:FAD-dependent oxidoreductase [Terriglobales bacterium]